MCILRMCTFFLLLSCIYVHFSQIVSSLHILRTKFCVHYSNRLSVLHVWVTSTTVPNFTTLNFIWTCEKVKIFRITQYFAKKIGCCMKIIVTAWTFTRIGVESFPSLYLCNGSLSDPSPSPPPSDVICWYFDNINIIWSTCLCLSKRVF